MNAEVMLQTKGDADHLRLFWQTAETMLEQIPFPEDAAQTRFNILVSIQEAISNVLRHGYSAPSVPQVELRLAWDGQSFTIELRDHAAPFDPTAVWALPDTSDPMAIPEGGYGIGLMREVLDSLEYRYEDGQNVLVLTKSVDRVESEV
ncbi:MAG: ATP-binding protein [Planctomycetes bacterium]|nr:ATP-binding protein [Planctomycetota bacterium]